jgi:isochorismate synthase/2-succinyl-5-enolpyruvyl-6-hydroxy-3-cyclohexene-1-carboxylate synthase/2-succinyl-6-hydroxy-2,4-cyclohexadiene-1-carboxylate synthase/O-succinylbenzoate synthase
MEHVEAQSEVLLEPVVARAVVQGVPLGSALFLGNSMPIRDADFYGGPYPWSTLTAEERRLRGREEGGAAATSGLGVRVTANRGASGIDGVVSAAAGFAGGLQRPVTLLIGDVSFMHDSNALLLLRERHGLPPLVVVVVNNEGGGIFNFLPVASMLPKDTFTPLFSTPPDVDIATLCQAHRIPHVRATSSSELKIALATAWRARRPCVVEAVTDREANTFHHAAISAIVREATQRALDVLKLRPPEGGGVRIKAVTYRRYRLPLTQPVTAVGSHDPARRHGLILRLESVGGQVAFSEVAPLEGLHLETLLDAEEQLQLLSHRLQGLEVPPEVAFLGGAFATWAFEAAGLAPAALHPSVALALELAVLALTAATWRLPLANLLQGQRSQTTERLPAPAAGIFPHPTIPSYP